jgi:predicted transcriptional regulator of viral defense system
MCRELRDQALTPNQIAASCGAKPVNVRKMLARMTAKGIVKRIGYGKYILG